MAPLGNLPFETIVREKRNGATPAMAQNRTDYIIARALCIAAAAEETGQADADAMLDLLIERYPALAQRLLHEIGSPQPAPHLRVAY